MASFDGQQLVSSTLGWAQGDAAEVTAQQLFGLVVEPIVLDTTPPVVSNVSPPENEEITRTTPVFLDVTDVGGFRRILLKVSFPDGTWDLAYDGSTFAPKYVGLSSVTVIATGFRFRLLRAGGWSGAPTVTPYAIDLAGNEA
jgi:hypothetical protein